MTQTPRGAAGGLLLAVETATSRTRVALLAGDALLGEWPGERGAATAEVLLPLIDAALTAQGARPDDLRAFAVSIGPGSFTSLRIGVATVKGLAFGTDKRAVAVPTLAALARSAPAGAGPVVAALDARRGEVYAACYEPGRVPEARLPPSVYDVESLTAVLPPVCRIVGEGAAVCGEALRERLGPGVLLFPECEPRAAQVGALAAQELARGGGEEPARLVPRYLRRAQAEVLRTGRALE